MLHGIDICSRTTTCAGRSGGRYAVCGATPCVALRRVWRAELGTALTFRWPMCQWPMWRDTGRKIRYRRVFDVFAFLPGNQMAQYNAQMAQFPPPMTRVYAFMTRVYAFMTRVYAFMTRIHAPRTRIHAPRTRIHAPTTQSHILTTQSHILTTQSHILTTRAAAVKGSFCQPSLIYYKYINNISDGCTAFFRTGNGSLAMFSDTGRISGTVGASTNAFCFFPLRAGHLQTDVTVWEGNCAIHGATEGFSCAAGGTYRAMDGVNRASGDT